MNEGEGRRFGSEGGVEEKGMSAVGFLCMGSV